MVIGVTDVVGFCCPRTKTIKHKLKNTPVFNPLNAELNPVCHLLALIEAHHILHVSRIRVNYVEARPDLPTREKNLEI